MKIIIGNLLTQSDVPNIAHGANCFHTMGAGVAKGISSLFPDAYKADLASTYGDVTKLGTYTTATCNNKLIYNIYSQYQTGKNIEYGALFNGLLAASRNVNNNARYALAIPYLMGCGIAGGDWRIVENIIDEVESIINKFNIKISIFGIQPTFEIVCYDIDGLSLTEPKV